MPVAAVNRLERREAALDQQLQLAPRRFAAAGKRNLECPPTTMRAPSSAARRASRFMFSNPAAIMTAVSRGRLCRRRIRAALEHGERRVEPWTPIAQHGIERLRVGAVEIQCAKIRYRPSRRASLSSSTACRYCSRSRARQQARAERGDVLDAVKPGEQRLACVEDLEMRRARDVMRVADLDHGPRACQRQPEVDFQRGRAPSTLRSARRRASSASRATTASLG